MASQVAWRGTLPERLEIRRTWEQMERHTEVDVRPFCVSPPFRRVALRGVHVLERNGEVDEEEIEIVYSPEFELIASHLGHVFRRVEGVPQLDINGRSGATSVIYGWLTLEVTTIVRASVRESITTTERGDSQTSSRFTIPLLMARARPSPASFSLP